MVTLEFAVRIGVVTGASKGIGQACAVVALGTALDALDAPPVCSGTKWGIVGLAHVVGTPMEGGVTR